VRKLAGNLFLDHRAKTEAAVIMVLGGAFLLATGADKFDETLDAEMRATLYDPLSAATGALLGFVLAALAVLVALPSTERIEKLQAHPRWHLVPSAYFRAARALLAALVLCLLGLPLDSGDDPWILYEVAAVVALAVALTRVVAAVVALDQILAWRRPTRKAQGNHDERNRRPRTVTRDESRARCHPRGWRSRGAWREHRVPARARAAGRSASTSAQAQVERLQSRATGPRPVL
jgi:hypothetical protein